MENRVTHRAQTVYSEFVKIGKDWYRVTYDFQPVHPVKITEQRILSFALSRYLDTISYPVEHLKH